MSGLQSHRRLPRAARAGRSPGGVAVPPQASPPCAPRISCSSRAVSRALGHLRGVAVCELRAMIDGDLGDGCPRDVPVRGVAR